VINYLAAAAILSISTYSEARLTVSTTNKGKNSKNIEIIYSTKKLSEIRKINEKTKKLAYWYIEDKNTQLEIKIINHQSIFTLKKYSQNNVKKISGIIVHDKINKLSNEISKSKIFFNECITNRLDMSKWLKELQSKMNFENDICTFSDNCNNEIRAQFIDFVKDESKFDKLKQAVSCTLPESSLAKLVFSKISSGAIQISCTPAEKSAFKAFYYKNENSEVINLDPKLFQNESDLIESLGHEVFHAAGTEDENQVKEYTSQFMTELKKPTPNCENRVSMEESSKLKCVGCEVAADSTLNQTTTTQSGTPITTNPAAAQRVAYELEQPVSASTLASLSTPSGQEQYIAATQPARTAALSWANDVVRAVGDTVIPSAHAGTLADSGSTSTKTRKIASVDGADSTTSASAKINTSHKPAGKAEQKTSASNSTAPSPQDKPNEVAAKANAKTAGPPPANSRNIAAVNTASGVRGSGSSNTAASGNISSGANSGLNQKAGSNSATSDVVSFIQNTDYRIVKEELNDSAFQDRLRREGVKIITLDGKVFGDKNGRVKFTDRGRTFVKESR